jgi:hypothetical protein
MNDLQTVWKNQDTAEKNMITLADIRANASKYQSRIRTRNIVLYLYSLATVISTVWLLSTGKYSLYAPPGILMIFAHLFVVWQVWWRAAARDIPGELGGRAALDFHRQELQRQHDVMSKAWLWYIAPFWPALIWEIWLRAQEPTPSVPPHADFMIVLLICVGAVSFWTAVWFWFSRSAARLQLQIQELDHVKAE